MSGTSQQIAKRNDRGFVLVAMLALVAALLGTGVAFMQWATDESIQGRHAEAKMQAYYVAQAGVLERGLTWLYQQQAGLMPRTETQLGDGVVAGIGRYTAVKVTPVIGSVEDNSNFSFDEKYRVQAYGIVESPWDGDDKADTAKAVLYVQVRSFVDYMYLTNYETSATFPGDIVRFWGCDTLWGRTHSNDWIATRSGGCDRTLPVFYDIVSTSKPSFYVGSPNPAGEFLGGPPRFNAPEVRLPDIAESIRNGATHLEGDNVEWRCVISGASATFYQWPEGTDFDSSQPTIISCSPRACVFVHGKLEMLGEMQATGCALTIGCDSDIRLIDNVMLIGTDPTTGELPGGATSIIGIVSEQWIYIANTFANGRENCAGDHGPHGRCHIVLTAAIVSLGGSFQFEQMNDVNDPYISPVAPDERGNIVMTGSITQYRRGYVHRSNLGGSGYAKVYHYDNRFRTRRPPCFMGATDADGRVLLNIVQWGQASEDPVDVAAQRRVRYN